MAREALGDLGPAGKAARCGEAGEVLPGFFAVHMAEALDCGGLDGVALDLSIDPRIPGLGRAQPDIAGDAGMSEGTRIEDLALGARLFFERDGNPPAATSKRNEPIGYRGTRAVPEPSMRIRPWRRRYRQRHGQGHVPDDAPQTSISRALARTALCIYCRL